MANTTKDKMVRVDENTLKMLQQLKEKTGISIGKLVAMAAEELDKRLTITIK